MHGLRHFMIGQETAHIKWFQPRRSDVGQNGLSLYSRHHEMFNLGAFTVLPEAQRILFSRHLMGGNDTTGSCWPTMAPN